MGSEIDHIWFDLRCFTCNADLFLTVDLGSNDVKAYCDRNCSRRLALSIELVKTTKELLDVKGLEWYFNEIDALAVADAMLEAPLPNRHKAEDGALPDGIRSWQARSRRIEWMEEAIAS